MIRIFQGKNTANQKIRMANLHSYFFHQLRKRTTLCDKSAGTDASSHTLLEQDHANELSLADHLQHSDHDASKADLTVLFQIIFSPLAAKANEDFVQAVSADPESFQKGTLNNNLKGHTISHLQLCASVHEHYTPRTLDRTVFQHVVQTGTTDCEHSQHE